MRFPSLRCKNILSTQKSSNVVLWHFALYFFNFVAFLKICCVFSNSLRFFYLVVKSYFLVVKCKVGVFFDLFSIRIIPIIYNLAKQRHFVCVFLNSLHFLKMVAFFQKRCVFKNLLRFFKMVVLHEFCFA